MPTTPAVSSGVFPCYKNQFKIGAAGSQSDPANAISDMEEYTVSVDNGIEEWRSFGEDGWLSRLMTAKGIKIAVKGKRKVGDAGNDLVAGMFFKNGAEAQADVLWTFPDGGTVKFANAVINVTVLNTGAAASVGPLEWEILSNGKPTYTPAA